MSSGDRVGKELSDAEVGGGQNSVDAASIVFAHSILDYCVNACCRISATVAPGDWELRVSRRKLALGECKDLGYSELLRTKVNEYIEEQTRRTSLVARIDLLNEKCQPAPPYEPPGRNISTGSGAGDGTSATGPFDEAGSPAVEVGLRNSCPDAAGAFQKFVVIVRTGKRSSVLSTASKSFA